MFFQSTEGVYTLLWQRWRSYEDESKDEWKWKNEQQGL